MRLAASPIIFGPRTIILQIEKGSMSLGTATTILAEDKKAPSHPQTSENEIHTSRPEERLEISQVVPEEAAEKEKLEPDEADIGLVEEYTTYLRDLGGPVALAVMTLLLVSYTGLEKAGRTLPLDLT
jgi:hypothetical protein